MDTGIQSPNLPRATTSESLLVNSGSGTARQTVDDLAMQLIASTPMRVATYTSTLYETEADLPAISAQVTPWVYADPDPNKRGIYAVSGGEWKWTLPLPYSVIRAEVAEGGTANVLALTTNLPVLDGMAVTIPISITNTGDVTAVINGGTALPVRTNSGLEVEEGGLPAGGRVIAVREGDELRLTSDVAVANLIQSAKLDAQQAREDALNARGVAVAAAGAAGTSETNAAASASAAAGTLALVVASAEAGGQARIFDNKDEATTEIETIADLEVVEVTIDETQEGQRTRYRKESGALVFKRVLSPVYAAKEVPSYLRALGDALDDTPRSIKSFSSVVGDGSTDQTTKLINALASGARNIVFPPDDAAYVVDGAVKVFAGTRITGQSGASILQKLVSSPALDAVGADDVEIRCLAFKADYPRTFVGTGYRGDNLYSSGAAIYHSGSRSLFEDIYVEGFCTGIFLGAWDEATSTQIAGRIGNMVRRGHFKTVDFGVLAKGQTGLKLKALVGENISLSAGSTNPPHTIYMTGAIDFRNVALSIEDITTIGCDHSAAVQMKWTDGAMVRGLVSKDAGMLSITSVNDAVISDVVGINAHSIGASQGAVYMFLQGDVATAISERVVYSNILINLEVDAARGATLIGNNCSGDFSIFTNNVSAVGIQDFSIGGNDNDYTLKIKNKGTKFTYGAQLRDQANIPTLDNNTVRVEAKGVTNLVTIPATATGTKVHYDPRVCSTESDGPFVINDGVGTTFRRAETEFALTVDPAVATIGGTDPNAIRGARASRFIIPIGDPTTADTNAHTIASPHESNVNRTPVGTVIEVVVQNLNASAALGSLSWGSLWKFKAAFTAPTAGRAARSTFRFDGTNWQEL